MSKKYSEDSRAGTILSSASVQDLYIFSKVLLFDAMYQCTGKCIFIVNKGNINRWNN